MARSLRTRAGTIVGVFLLVVAAIGLAVRYVPIDDHRTLYLVIASPFLMLAAPIAVLTFLVSRRTVPAAVTALFCAVLAVPQLPWYVAVDAAPDGLPIRVMTINMLYGQADPAALVRAADGAADVLMVQELTSEAARGLASAGLQDAFPYESLDPRPESAGLGIYSRYPIVSSQRIGGYTMAMVSVRVRVDGITRDPALLSLHPAAPWPQPIDNWRRDIGKLPTTLAQLADQSDGGAVLVAGDFNSTIDMRPFRNLLTNGYRDAAEQAAGGRQRTYPANLSIPPFMGIDHVLTRDATATSTETVRVAGSDHLGIIATISVPRG